jgi:hypothetical protein
MRFRSVAPRYTHIFAPVGRKNIAYAETLCEITKSHKVNFGNLFLTQKLWKHPNYNMSKNLPRSKVLVILICNIFKNLKDKMAGSPLAKEIA